MTTFRSRPFHIESSEEPNSSEESNNLPDENETDSSNAHTTEHDECSSCYSEDDISEFEGHLDRMTVKFEMSDSLTKKIVGFIVLNSFLQFVTFYAVFFKI